MNNTTNAQFIPTIIANKAIGRLPAFLNLARTVARNSDWTTATVGTTLSVPVRGAVSANDKTAGSNFTKQNPTATNVNVVLNKHKEVTLTIDDFTKVVENQDTQNGYAEDGAIALAEAVEETIAALHSGITNVLTFDATSDTTVDQSMLRIRRFFTVQKVPRTEQRYFYVDSTVFNRLLQTDKYSRYDARGDGKAIGDGMVIRTYGLEISESQMVQTTGSPVAYHNLAYTKNAIVLANRPLPRPEGFGGRYAIVNDGSIQLSLRTLFWYNADLGAHQLTMDLLYGVAIVDQRRIVEVESF